MNVCGIPPMKRIAARTLHRPADRAAADPGGEAP